MIYALCKKSPVNYHKNSKWDFYRLKSKSDSGTFESDLDQEDKKYQLEIFAFHSTFVPLKQSEAKSHKEILPESFSRPEWNPESKTLELDLDSRD